MRRLSIFLIALAGSLFAAEPAYPLWDGESVADYAKKVNLPPTQSLDLGNGVKLELVLIPAGKFIMGTPEPEKPIVGQTMVGVSVGALFVVIMLMLIRSRKKRKRIQFSMGFMLLLTIFASGIRQSGTSVRLLSWEWGGRMRGARRSFSGFHAKPH